MAKDGADGGDYSPRSPERCSAGGVAWAPSERTINQAGNLIGQRLLRCRGSTTPCVGAKLSWLEHQMVEQNGKSDRKTRETDAGNESECVRNSKATKETVKRIDSNVKQEETKRAVAAAYSDEFQQQQ
jgi:hypothetical protein